MAKKDQVKTRANTATGRRKTATASFFYKEEKGDITVNGVSFEEYFTSTADKINFMKPFFAVGISHPNSQLSGSIKVAGSGKSSQLGAMIHAISRALAKINPEFLKILRKQGLLTRDPRMVERKKYYLKKARKAPQYSKR